MAKLNGTKKPPQSIKPKIIPFGRSAKSWYYKEVNTKKIIQDAILLASDKCKYFEYLSKVLIYDCRIENLYDLWNNKNTPVVIQLICYDIIASYKNKKLDSDFALFEYSNKIKRRGY